MMKKKLLAIVLSIVMIATLLVPMFAINAAAPTAKLGIFNLRKTVRNDVNDNPVDVLAMDVNISENTDYFFAGRFMIVSEQNVAPFVSKQGRKEVKGYDPGTFASGDASLNYAVTPNGDSVVALGKTGFQVLVDSTNEKMGIDTEAGSLGTYYFVAPTAPGTYTFNLVWIDGVNDGYNEETEMNDNVQKYTVTVNPETITYSVACTNHSEVKDEENSTPAKCGVAGENVYKCSVCGNEIRREPVTALEHDWVRDEANDVAPKCEVTGEEAYKCNREGCSATDTKPVDALTHNWVKDADASTAPKCGVSGEDVFVCQNAGCPKGTKTEPVAALEHNWDNGTPVGNVACGSTADVVYHCQNADCPNPEKTVTGAIVEHDWVKDDAQSTPAVCGQGGIDVFVCQNPACPEGTKSVPTAPLTHNWVKDEAASTAPKCEVSGEDVFVCQNAGCPEGTKTEPVDALVHDWVKDDAQSTPAICGQGGTDVFVCQNAGCPVGTREEPTDPLTHNYVLVNTIGATCINPGEKIYRCQNEGCPDLEKREPIDATGVHHYSDNGEEVTGIPCGQPSQTRHYCDLDPNCHDYEVRNGAPVEHDWVKDAAASTAPKCEVPGEDVFVCQNANCPEGTKTEPVDALEHDWVKDEDASTAPKCEVPGEDVFVCQNANCPEGTKTEPVDALGHNYDYNYYEDMEIVEAPTADKVGKAKVPCSNGCGKFKEVELDKLATEIELGNDIITSEEAILPEDFAVNFKESDTELEEGKYELTFVFSSNIVKDLEGEITYSIDISLGGDSYQNYAAYVVNADNTRTLVSEIVNGMLVIKANLKDNIVFTFEDVPQVEEQPEETPEEKPEVKPEEKPEVKPEVKPEEKPEEKPEKAPATGDNMNVVVLAAAILAAVAGLVVVGKKRFSL